MADISKIQLPTGTTYDIKDAVARTPVLDETASNFVTAASGYTISVARIVTCGKIAQFVLSISSSSAMNISASGDVTNFTCATLKTGYRPLINAAFGAYGDYNSACGLLRPDGSVRVCGFQPQDAAHTIAAGTAFTVVCTYILA